MKVRNAVAAASIAALIASVGAAWAAYTGQLNIIQWAGSVIGTGTIQPFGSTETTIGSGNVPAFNDHITNTSLPLPSGAATSSNQSTEITSLGTIATNSGTQATAANQTSVIGTKAAGTAAASALLTGGVYNSGGVTLTTGQQAAAQMTAAGSIHVAADALPAGANTIGAVTQASGPWSTNLTQVGGSTGYAPLAGGSAPTNGIAVVAVYNSSAPSLTNGQAAGLQLTSAGSLHTTVDNTLTSITPGDAVTTSTYGSASPTIGVPFLWNGTSYDRWKEAAATGVGRIGAASGDFASGSLASGAVVDLTNLTGTKAAGTAAADSLLAGSVYNSSPLTLTTGQQAALQSDSSGYLNVHIQAGAGSGGTALTDNTAFGQSSTSETPIGCLYISAYTAATSGRSTIPQCDSNGRLIVNVNSLPALAAGANTIGAVTQASGPWMQNLTQVAGSAISQGHGTAASAIRVELPTDGTGVVGLAAGANTIGAVTQASGPWTQNQTQVNSVAISTGAGATGTGTQRVGVAQDTTTIAGSAPGTAGTPSTNVVSVQGVSGGTPLITNLTQIGGATGYGPLAGGTAPTNGIGILGQYNSSAPTLTNGQVAAVQFDVNGNVKVAGQGLAQGSTTSGQAGSLVLGAATTAAPSYTTAQSNPLSLDLSGNLRVVTPAITCNNHTFKHITTAIDTPVVTGVSSQIVYICGIEPKFAGTATVYVENDGGTSASCGDTLTQIGGLYSGVAQSFPGFYAPTWGGFKNTSGNGVCLKSTGTGGVDVDIWWAQQ